jgi:hypothetical protein
MKSHLVVYTLRVSGALVSLAGFAVSFAAAATATSPQPEVSISLRGILDGAVEVGEPFRVAVRVDAPNDAAKLQLAPAHGSWTKATSVEIVSADGNVIAAQSTVDDAEHSIGGVAVDLDNPATGLWWFAAESLNGVSVGDYVVRARLVIADGTGWKGEALSEPQSLRVIPASADPERVLHRKINHARAALVAGEPAKAAEILNPILETDPNSLPALVLQTMLSLQGGNLSAAQACIDRALMLSSNAGEEPSAELHHLANVINQARNEPARVTEVAAWSRLPRSVWEPLRSEQSSIPGLGAPDPGDRRSTPAAVPIAVGPAAPTPRPNTATIAAPPPPTVSSTPPTLAIAANNAGGATLRFDGSVVNAAELSDAKIVSDPAGQWAATATAGSQYGRTQYSATQATGAPNVPVAGNSPDAWCPAVRDKGLDWLEVTFAIPTRATELRVRQNDASGAIAKIEAFEADGTGHVWWEGIDPHVAGSVREIVWFAVRLPQTSYLVAKVKLTLNLASGPGYKEIDAVQLVGATP